MKGNQIDSFEKRKFQNISELATIRQQSLENFFSFGGKVNSSMKSSMMLPNHANKNNNNSTLTPNGRVSPHVSCHNFCKDAKVMTHPLYMTALAYRGCHRNTSASSSPCHPITLHQAIQEIYTNKLVIKPLTLQSYGSTQQISMNSSNRMGIQQFSLDDTGALLAVGHQSGNIAIYDMDEVFLQLMNSKRLGNQSLRPVLSFETKKSIGKIIWRKSFPDDIFLSFQFSPQIYHYSLSLLDAENPVQTPLTVFLPDGKGNNSCGHKSLLVWTRTIQFGSSVRNEEYVISGSTNGYIRCWKMVNTTVSSGHQQAVTKCHWNVRNDVSRPLNLARPVIGVFLLPHYSSKGINCDDTHMLAITDDGLFTIWNIVHLKTASFGSTGNEPSFIASFSLTDRLLLSPSSGDRLIRNVQCRSCPHHTTQLPVTSNEDESITIYETIEDPSSYLIQLEDGSIFLFNLLTQQIQGYPYQYHSVLNPDEHAVNLSVVEKSKAIPELNPSVTVPNVNRSGDSITTSYEGLGTLLLHRSSSIHIASNYCAIGLSFNQEPMLLVLPSSRGETTSILQKIPLTTSFTDPYHHNTTNYLYSSISSLYFRNIYTGLIESSLIRVPFMSFTLPGRIISAVKGDTEILVSVDLQGYLGNDYVSINCLSRSNDIRIEYFLDDGQGLGYQDYTVQTVRQHYLQLATMYQGPEVINGFPKVWLRTNLAMKGWSFDSYYQQEMIDKKSKKLNSNTDTGVSLKLNKHWPNCQVVNLFSKNTTTTINDLQHSQRSDHENQENSIVGLFHHPFYPFVLAGRLDDSISVLSYEGKYQYSEGEENSSKVYRANEMIDYYPHYTEGESSPEVVELNENIPTPAENSEKEELKQPSRGIQDDATAVENTEEIEVRNELEQVISEQNPVEELTSPSMPASWKETTHSIKRKSTTHPQIQQRPDPTMEAVKNLFAQSKSNKINHLDLENQPSINQKRNHLDSIEANNSNELKKRKKNIDDLRPSNHQPSSIRSSNNKITNFFVVKK